jgi:hypothetical protein
MALIVLFCGGLVAYPMVYLVAESPNTGDFGTFPPESIGLDSTNSPRRPLGRRGGTCRGGAA